MYYIKLDENRELVTTVYEPIYRGENLTTKIIYLVPPTIGDVDILVSQIYLSYIRADGEPEILELHRLKNMYKEKYYQYILPVQSKMSSYPGTVVSWMHIFSGEKDDPTIIKSGTNLITISESPGIDGRLADRLITAIWETRENIRNIPDDLTYDDNTRKLQLKSGDTNIGSPVIVPSDDYGEDKEDEWGGMDRH